MIFVYYDDDYPDAGGFGLEEFKDIDEAEIFIQDRIRVNPTERKPENYTVIQGSKKTVRILSTAIAISIE